MAGTTDDGVLSFDKMKNLMDTVEEKQLEKNTELVEAFMALGFKVQVNPFIPDNMAMVILPGDMQKAYDAAVAKIEKQGHQRSPIGGIINVGTIA